MKGEIASDVDKQGQGQEGLTSHRIAGKKCHVHRDSNKTTTLVHMSSPNRPNDAFSKFFHWHTQQHSDKFEIKLSRKIPQRLKHVATLPFCELLTTVQGALLVL